MGRRKSMPASSAMWASFRLSCQLPDQRSGTVVTARPDEQLGPNKPIFSRFALYIARRSRIEVSFGVVWSIASLPLKDFCQLSNTNKCGEFEIHTISGRNRYVFLAAAKVRMPGTTSRASCERD